MALVQHAEAGADVQTLELILDLGLGHGRGEEGDLSGGRTGPGQQLDVAAGQADLVVLDGRMKAVDAAEFNIGGFMPPIILPSII